MIFADAGCLDRLLGRGPVFLAMLTATTLGASISAAPPAIAQETCMKTDGRVTLERPRSGCASPVELCLAGTVTGTGFLDGATWRFTAGAKTPSGSSVSYTGETVITVRTGMITTSTRASLESGTILIRDQVATVDVKEARLMGSREVFQKGTGVLSTKGAGSLEQGFPAEVTGEICLRK